MSDEPNSPPRPDDEPDEEDPSAPILGSDSDRVPHGWSPGSTPGEPTRPVPPEARPAGPDDPTQQVGPSGPRERRTGSRPDASAGEDTWPSEVREAAADPRRRIDRYVLLDELGRGGMGVVFRAWDPNLRREVALKVMLAGEHAREEEVARFYREARAAARLRHPGIVPVHEVGTTEPTRERPAVPYFAMELVRGRTLSEWLADDPGPRAIVEKLRDVARALAHAHEEGVVHRDIKPGNILIDAEGETPRVTDFGLARDVQQERVTRTGDVLGTPAYMAPEQVDDAGSDEVDARTDVYALGAVLYRAICGRPPFEGESALNVITALLTKEPPSPRSVTENVHRDLETIALRCLEKDPDRRYASAEALAADLDRFLRGEPIEARPVGRLEAAVRWARRNRALATTIGLSSAVVIGLLITGVIGAYYSVQRIRTERDAARDARQLAEARREDAEAARREAEEAATREARAAERAQTLLGEALREKAERHRAEGRYAGAAALAAHSLRIRETVAGRSILAEALPRMPRTVWATAHAGISDVRWSTDGSRLLTREGRQVRVWDASTGRVRLLIGAGRSRAMSTLPLPDGSIVTGGEDGFLRFWDGEDGTLLGQVEAEAPIERLARPVATDVPTVLALGDGVLRVTGGPGDPRLERVPLPDGAAPVAIASSPEGRRLAVGTEDGRVLVLGVDLRVRSTLEGPGGPVEHLSWSPEGDRLLLGNGEGAAVLVAPDGEGARTRIPGEARAVGWRWSPAGHLIGASTDGRVLRWSPGDAEPESLRLPGNPSLRALSESPGGRLAVVLADRTLRVEIPGTDAWARVGEVGTGPVEELALSPDGTRLVEVGPDRVVLRNGGDGRPLRVHRAEKHFVSVAWHPGGERLAAGDRSGGVHVLDASTLEELEVLRPGPGTFWEVGWSPDGTRLAVLGGRRLRILDEAGRVRADVGPLADLEAQALAWAPRGQTVAFSTGRSEVMVLDVATRRMVASLNEPDAFVQDLAWSHDGRWVAIASEDGSLLAWDTREERGHQLVGSGTPLRAVSFEPSGRYLLSAGEEGEVTVWNLQTATTVATLGTVPGGVTDLVGTERHVFVGVTAGTVRALMLPLRRHDLSFNDTILLSGAWSPVGSLIAVGDQAGTIRLVSAEGEFVDELSIGSAVYAVAWSPRGTRLATGHQDGDVRVWTIAAGSSEVVAEGPDATVALQWSEQEEVGLVCGWLDGTVRLVDPSDERGSRSIPTEMDDLTSLALHPSAPLLAVAGLDDPVTVWNLDRLDRAGSFEARVHPVTTLAWSPAGDRLVWTGATSVLRGATWPDGRPAGWTTGEPPGPNVRSMAWQPEGGLLAWLGSDGRLRLWDTEAGRKVLDVAAHGAKGRAVSWAPDGSAFASAGEDGDVRFWSLEEMGLDASPEELVERVREEAGLGVQGMTPVLLTDRWRIPSGETDAR